MTTPPLNKRVFFDANKRCTALRLKQDARAGIRTRVSGMKTRDDGPGYTTRANDQPCRLLFITVGHPMG